MIKWCLDTTDKALGLLGLSVADLVDFQNKIGTSVIVAGYSAI